ncbi:AraC family transcriptional regulator [Paenibacillus sp. B01]|uniref:AraC family transcriptional regulator n=1 Tax=Paenibacillus sp. B01 TaxID=2660554 RepID=UPI001891D1A9|nr:helix-turn-helix domain-containing protein [Paenibacillus sp. B01]
MKSSWFRKLLLSYLPAFFIVVSILFVVFFQALNEQSRKEAAKANDFLVQQAIRHADNSLRAIDYRILQDILGSAVLKDFYRAEAEDVFVNLQADRLMDSWAFGNPAIDSIYLYRPRDGFVFGDGSLKTEPFRDAAFLRSYLDGERPIGQWSDKRSFQPYAMSKPAEVMTIVRAYPGFSSVKTGYVVVNVSLSKLGQELASMYDPGQTFIAMSDRSGQPAIGPRLDGGELVLAQYVSPYTGWTVSSGPTGKGLKLTLDLYSVWLVLALGAVLLGIAWVVHVTRRNYRPISQLVSLIRSSSLVPQDGPGADRNELGFIRLSLEQLMEEMKRSKQQDTENRLLRKRHRFLEALAGGAPISQAEWESDLERLGFEPRGRTAFAWTLEIDRHAAFCRAYTAHDQAMLKFVLASVVTETVQGGGGAAWAEWTGDRRMSAIVWLPPEAGLDEARRLAAEASDWIRDNLAFGATMALHGPAGPLEEIRRSADIAASLLAYKAALGTGEVITPDRLGSGGSPLHDHFGTIQQLAQAFRTGDPGWRERLRSLYAQIRQSCFSRQEIESLQQVLYQQMDRMFLELAKEYWTAWKEAEAELLALDREWEALDELEAGCLGALERMDARMSELRDSQSARSEIAQIRAYMEENFGSPELSLDYFGDRFSIHPKTISKLFKEQFGENFIDFLMGLRMEQAKRMLGEPSLSLQEISRHIGYYNYNSFNRAFKNHTGMSPSDFRKRAPRPSAG